MKIYLMTETGWKLFEGELLGDELLKRKISIGEGARIGAWASIGEGARIGEEARIGEGASIKSAYGLLVMGPLGSRQAMLTAYLDKNILMIGTGCFLDTADKFLAAVKETHSDNEHGKAYGLAVEFAEKYFKSMEAGK